MSFLLFCSLPFQSLSLLLCPHFCDYNQCLPVVFPYKPESRWRIFFLLFSRVLKFLPRWPWVFPPAGRGWGIMAFPSLPRLAPDIPSCFPTCKASLHWPLSRTFTKPKLPEALKHRARHTCFHIYSITRGGNCSSKEKVVDNEEWEKELGICGILCNELVRKECE